MIKAHGAPIDDAGVPKIVNYLAKFDANPNLARAIDRTKTRGISHWTKFKTSALFDPSRHQMIAKQAKCANAPR